MSTTIEEIENNEVEEADVSIRPFDVTSSRFHSALRNNTSITKLDLSSCQLFDDDFAHIAEALIDRKANLTELNLNYNDLTTESIPSIQKLIQNKKIGHLLIYKNDGLDDNQQAMLDLNKLAEENGIKITAINPLEIKYPGFFDRVKAGLRGNSDESNAKQSEQKKNIK